MKAALILKGQAKWPSGSKLLNAGVKRLYYEANDPQIDAAFFKQLRDWGYEGGFMIDPGWFGSMTADQLVAKTLDYLKAFGAPPAPMPVMFDLEMHNEAYVFDVLSKFKTAQPGRNTAWTLEYHQAGWFSDRLVNFMNAWPQFRIIPQCYYGDMNQVVDSSAALRDLCFTYPTVKVLQERVNFFYSTRVQIPADWNGVLYVENWSLLP